MGQLTIYETVITLGLAALGLRSAWVSPRVWRNELGWDPDRPVVFWAFGLAAWRGLVRAQIAAIPMLLALTPGYALDNAGAEGPLAQAVLVVSGVVGGTLLFIVAPAIVLLNRPKWAVVPHLRHQSGAIAEWRGKRSAPTPAPAQTPGLPCVDPVARYRHPELGFAIDLPAGAEVVAELPPVVALDPAGGRTFQPTCVITAEPLVRGLGLEAWVDSGWELQRDRLVAPLLIDRQPAEVGGRPALRTLAHHSVGDHAVTLEQWWALGPDRGWALSASCATLDYDEVADAFDRMHRLAGRAGSRHRRRVHAGRSRALAVRSWCRVAACSRSGCPAGWRLAPRTRVPRGACSG